MRVQLSRPWFSDSHQHHRQDPTLDVWPWWQLFKLRAWRCSPRAYDAISWNMNIYLRRRRVAAVQLTLDFRDEHTPRVNPRYGP